MCHDDGMTNAAGPALIISFAQDLDDRSRGGLLHRLAEAQLPASTGLELGHRGPGDGSPRVLALVTLMAEVSEVGATAVSGLGMAVGRWLRSVSQPDDPAFADLIDQPGQHVWRMSARDSGAAVPLLSRAAAQAAQDTPLTWNGLNWSGAAPGRTHPAVFIVYAHESSQHKADVLTLCEVLAASGVEPRVDMFYLDDRRDWQLWATSQITGADYVLVIASPGCRLVGDGTNAPGTHHGLQSEMRILRELYHSENAEWIRRILPVVLPGRSIDDIPLFLQPRTADHFALAEITAAGADDLLRILHRTPRFSPPPVR